MKMKMKLNAERYRLLESHNYTATKKYSVFIHFNM